MGNHSRYPESSNGGAIHNRGVAGEQFSVTNCIFWDNGQNCIYSTSAGPEINYSDIGGTYSGFADGGGNLFNQVPLFTDTVYHLLPGSPCINSGQRVRYEIYYDLDGNSRTLSNTTDMGVYEYNSAPDCIFMHDTIISENLKINTVAATLSGHDPDPEHSYLYFSLVDGDGTNDVNNSWFVCGGQNFTVKVRDSIDY